MSQDNVIRPGPFQLANRKPVWLPEEKQGNAILNFQVAIFESGKRAFKKLSPKTISAGSTLLRNVTSPNCANAFMARAVPPNASRKTNVRWSGFIEGTNISKGALYTSGDLNGLLNEAMRYKRDRIERKVPWRGSTTGTATYLCFGPTTRDYDKLLVGQVYYAFELLKSLRVVDLTWPISGEFYEAVENDRSYQNAKRDLRVQQDLRKIAFDSGEDYTGSRPLGLSVLLNSATDGMQVQTAQCETREIAGDGLNIVLGGDDGKEIQFLKPVAKLMSGKSHGYQALLKVPLDGTSTGPTILPGSVLPIVDK